MQLLCRDWKRWETWLATHHAKSDGVWLFIAKKGSKQQTLPIGDALSSTRPSATSRTCRC